MRLYLLFLGMMMTVQSFAQHTKDTAAIQREMANMATCWNRGDLVGYMTGYWDSDSLIFMGKKGPIYGYKTILESYQKWYSDTAAMGKFEYSHLIFKRLSADYYFVIGNWALTRTAGNVDGTFTLLFRKIKKKWKIIVDHSS